MIAACPKCQARYRVAAEQIGHDGVRLRCAKCDAVFRVRAPQAEAEPAPVPSPAPAQVPAPVQPSPAPAQAPAPVQPSPAPAQVPAPVQPSPAPAEVPAPGGEQLVLIADPEVEDGKRLVNSLAAWGLQTVLVHDGVEAMLAIQRSLPGVVVLDAALPKMYGFQVCEVLKRNESLRGTKVILVGAVHNADRYRRAPDDLYGADAYLEKPQLMTELPGLLRGFGYGPKPDAAPAAPVVPIEPIQPVQAAPAPLVADAPEPAPVPEATLPPQAAAPPQAAPPAAAGDELADERENAERLARIIVSDLILYHPGEFETGLRSGDVAGALDAVLEEGRTLFRQRIDERVRDERDYLIDELLRVARSRGMG